MTIRSKAKQIFVLLQAAHDSFREVAIAEIKTDMSRLQIPSTYEEASLVSNKLREYNRRLAQMQAGMSPADMRQKVFEYLSNPVFDFLVHKIQDHPLWGINDIIQQLNNYKRLQVQRNVFQDSAKRLKPETDVQLGRIIPSSSASIFSLEGVMQKEATTTWNSSFGNKAPYSSG